VVHMARQLLEELLCLMMAWSLWVDAAAPCAEPLQLGSLPCSARDRLKHQD
jgi:hypothetical protein